MFRVPILLFLLAFAAAACLPDPNVRLGASLVNQMAESQRRLVSTSTPDTACDAGGEARAKLLTEPEPRGAPGAWAALLDASRALLAACGQLTLLTYPSEQLTAAGQSARDRWRAGAREDLRQACQSLQQAASRLGQAAPACATS